MVGCIENTVASAACCLPDEFVLCPCNYQPHMYCHWPIEKLAIRGQELQLLLVGRRSSLPYHVKLIEREMAG